MLHNMQNTWRGLQRQRSEYQKFGPIDEAESLKLVSTDWEKIRGWGLWPLTSGWESVTIQDEPRGLGFSWGVCLPMLGGGKLTHQYIINSGQERKKGCVKWSWWGDLSPAPRWALLGAQYRRNHEIKQEKKCFSPFTRPLDCFIKAFE